MQAIIRTSLLFLAAGSAALAQVDDILANVGAYKPRITLSDRYTEKVATITEDGDSWRELQVNPESIAITVVANLDGAVTGVIDADTSVGVTAWHFDHSATLGDAPDYKPGLKRATFPLTMDVDLPNGDTRTVRVGSVLYVWTAKTLTVTVTCTDVAGAGVGDIAASDYVGIADPRTAVSIVDDPVDVSVIFGDATGARRAFLRGITHTVVRPFGAKTSPDYEEFEVVDVTLQGAADVAGPEVKATWPAKPNTSNKVDVIGTATDVQDVTLDTITVNGVAAAATVGLSQNINTGLWSWNVTGLQLKKGANAIAITFSDEDGNQTKVTRSYTLAK